MQNAKLKKSQTNIASFFNFAFCILHFAFVPKGGDPMTPTRKIALMVTAWVAVITAAHMATNVDWTVLLNERLPESQRKLNVAYIPVT
jgi:hypothetical protein